MGPHPCRGDQKCSDEQKCCFRNGRLPAVMIPDGTPRGVTMKATGDGSRGDRGLDLVWRREAVSTVMPTWATAGAVALMVWLLHEIARRRDARPLHGSKAGLIPIS